MDVNGRGSIQLLHHETFCAKKERIYSWDTAGKEFLFFALIPHNYWGNFAHQPFLFFHSNIKFEKISSKLKFEFRPECVY